MLYHGAVSEWQVAREDNATRSDRVVPTRIVAVTVAVTVGVAFAFAFAFAVKARVRV